MDSKGSEGEYEYMNIVKTCQNLLHQFQSAVSVRIVCMYHVKNTNRINMNKLIHIFMKNAVGGTAGASDQ